MKYKIHTNNDIDYLINGKLVGEFRYLLFWKYELYVTKDGRKVGVIKNIFGNAVYVEVLNNLFAIYAFFGLEKQAKKMYKECGIPFERIL